MDENTLSSQANNLSYLIPTGEHDIAVRELLIPIFGDAIACKVPGAVCGGQTIGDSGALASSIFTIFNGGTLIFVTILLIFIGMFAFVKTAQDGEFLGKSWNTTFTALRLMTGIAFILPMPNGYSTVQNLTMYVGLWSSGLANEANVAVSEHYLKRLQMSIINQEPEATSIRNEAQELLVMHTCAQLIDKLYPDANLMYETSGLGTNGLIEFAYVARGSYLPHGSVPCGRLVVKPHKPAMPEDGTKTSGVWNAALGSAPLTKDARLQMMDAANNLSKDAREAKVNAVQGLASPNGLLNNLATYLVDRYTAGLVEYSDNGVSKAPEKSMAENFSPEAVATAVNLYASIIRSTESRLNNALEEARKSAFEHNAKTGEGTFFSYARATLQNGGWMGAASTYRTMLDMVSFVFQGDKQSPFRFEGRDESEGYAISSSGGIASHISLMRKMVYETLSSDTAKELMAKSLGKDSNTVIAAPPLNEVSLAKIASSKLSTNDAIELLYGASYLNGMRDSVIRGMTLSADADPLFQMKSIGDMVTSVAEFMVAVEFGTRIVLASAQVGTEAAKSNAVGRAVNWWTGLGDSASSLVSAAKYVTEQIFVTMKALTLAMVALGYAFSTWLPAIPFIAFLLAQLGWLFGMIMTLFAMNIWSVMHTTPARNDSFIGSEAQGYLLLVSLFFRPIIAVSALSLSYIIAPPVVKLVNLTLLPMMFTTNVSTNTLSIITMTLFGLVLYFTVIKGVLVMVYMIPQSFPDDVMRIISAGIGDLGQSKAMGTMETSEGTARAGIQTLQGIDKASGESFQAKLKERRDTAEKNAKKATQASQAKDIGGVGDSQESVIKEGVTR